MEAAYYKNIDYLWTILEGLKQEDKIELATRLIGSLRPKKKIKVKKEKEINEEEILDKLAGSWADDGQSADELIKFLRESRFTNRQIESLD